MSKVILKIVDHDSWQLAENNGVFEGASIDIEDGYIHFSSVDQVKETAARHFADRAGLLLVVVKADELGSELKWEPSRGGQLFPHLYGVLETSKVEAVHPLPLGEDGQHIFPDLGSL